MKGQHQAGGALVQHGFVNDWVFHRSHCCCCMQPPSGNPIHSPVRVLLAGASACTACIAGTYSNSTGVGSAALWRARHLCARVLVVYMPKKGEGWAGRASRR